MDARDERIAQLEARLHEVSERLAALERPSGQQVAPQPDAAGSRVASRRDLLRLAGLGSVGAMAAVVATPGTAAAVDGDTLKVGQTVTSSTSATTVLKVQAAATGTGFGVNSTVSDISGPTVPADLVVWSQSRSGISASTAASGRFAVYGRADSGVGIKGEGGNHGIEGRCVGSTGAGVLGTTGYTDGSGVRGTNTGAGIGVQGTSVSGTGGWFESNDGVGLWAVSSSGVAIEASTPALAPAIDTYAESGIGGRFRGGQAGIQLLPRPGFPGSPLAESGASERGMITVDDGGGMWVCVADGNPGQWRRVAAADSTGALTLLPAPVRCYDSRSGYAPAGVAKGLLAAKTARTVDLQFNGTGVPTTARGAVLNVTATATTAAGFASVWAQGAWPGTSNLNWTGAGATTPNFVVSACGPGATVQVRVSTAAHVIVDVAGYYL